MKPLLMFALTLITLTSTAQFNGDNQGSPLTVTCVVVITLMCMFIAAIVFLLINNNKRRDMNENNNLGKNT